MSKILRAFLICIVSLASFSALAGLGRHRGYEDEPPGNTKCEKGMKHSTVHKLGGQACFIACTQKGGGISCNSMNERITNRQRRKKACGAGDTWTACVQKSTGTYWYYTASLGMDDEGRGTWVQNWCYDHIISRHSCKRVKKTDSEINKMIGSGAWFGVENAIPEENFYKYPEIPFGTDTLNKKVVTPQTKETTTQTVPVVFTRTPNTVITPQTTEKKYCPPCNCNQPVSQKSEPTVYKPLSKNVSIFNNPDLKWTHEKPGGSVK